MTTPSPSSWWASLSLWLATGLGFGYAPFAPGTVGAVWGIPLTLMLFQLPHTGLQIVTLCGLFALGIPMCSSAAVSLGKKDPGAVVWDEIVTVPMVFLFLEPRLVGRVEILLLGFALHRLFDIAKPWPVHSLEKLPAGAGIMCDDAVAAAYAWCALRVLIWCVPWLAR